MLCKGFIYLLSVLGFLIVSLSELASSGSMFVVGIPVESKTDWQSVLATPNREIPQVGYPS